MRATILLILAVLAPFAAATARAALPEFTQSLDLEAGWNAVWLEVDPRDASGALFPPAIAFGDPAVELVAAFLPGGAGLQFVSDPSETPFDEDIWAVHYRRDPAGRSGLSGVMGNHAYLVKTNTATTVGVTGTVALHHRRWAPDAYTLTGFCIQDGPPPTFGSYFAPEVAAAHATNKIFRLQDGDWVGVRPSDPVLPGHA